MTWKHSIEFKWIERKFTSNQIRYIFKKHTTFSGGAAAGWSLWSNDVVEGLRRFSGSFVEIGVGGAPASLRAILFVRDNASDRSVSESSSGSCKKFENKEIISKSDVSVHIIAIIFENCGYSYS